MNDIDHIRTEDGWAVWCPECKQRFDSKRDDAQYCSSTCRSRAHRRELKREQAIAEAVFHVRQVTINLPRVGLSKEFKALMQLKRDIESALADVESDDLAAQSVN